MSVRRQLYDALFALPDGNPVLRIMGISAYLDSLPAEEAEVTARRLLALTMAYDIELKTGMKSTLEDFSRRVDEIDQTLVN